MKTMQEKGLSLAAIGIKLNLSASTVSYHLNEEQRTKQIERSKKNEKPRKRKEYNKNYQAKRYKTDPEFRERIKKANRENQRRKNGK